MTTTSVTREVASFQQISIYISFNKTQVSDSGPLCPLVLYRIYAYAVIVHTRADQLLPQLLMQQFHTLRNLVKKNILREKSLAIYFGDSQFRRNRSLNFIVSKIYVDKRSQVQ